MLVRIGSLDAMARAFADQLASDLYFDISGGGQGGPRPCRRRHRAVGCVPNFFDRQSGVDLTNDRMPTSNAVASSPNGQ